RRASPGTAVPPRRSGHRARPPFIPCYRSVPMALTWFRLAQRHRNRRPAPTPPGTRLRLEQFETRLTPSTFVVSNTGDSGPGSLRQAILDANASAGASTIAFDIGDGGGQTIVPASPLPLITQSVTIDGTTQPGFAGAPLITLDGSQAGGTAFGLDLLGAD